MILSNSSYNQPEEFIDPTSIKIVPGTKTNLKRAKSGKLWGQSVRHRDTLVLTFEKMLPEMGVALQQWIYRASQAGWKGDAYAFDIYIRRQASNQTASVNGFKGRVYFDKDVMTLPIGNFWASSFTLDFRIIQLLDF